MPKVKAIRDYFEAKVPSRLKMDFDNVGLLAGETEYNVSRVLVALDITLAVINEAAEHGAQLIVSHHPVIFTPLKRIVDSDPAGKKIISMIQKRISAICLHTNLDSVSGGVNDALMNVLGAKTTGILDVMGTDDRGDDYGVGRIGALDNAMEFSGFLSKCKSALNTRGLRYHDAGRMVSRIAVCGGSGGSSIKQAFNMGCDTYITADIKYDQFLEAADLGINLIDGDHFCTENVVVPVLGKMLLEGFPELDVIISAVHGQTANFY